MRCPNCNAENARDGGRCASCGTSLSRRVKRRGVAEESDSPFSNPIEPHNWLAIWAYRVAVCALIPGVGLALGPAAVLAGLAARWRGSRDPEFTARGPANAAVLMGLFISLTNWLGFVLMIRGLTGS
jgi:hypothetical protein